MHFGFGLIYERIMWTILNQNSIFNGQKMLNMFTHDLDET